MFDLDGTLVDTVPDISVALNAALDDLEFPPVSMEQTRRWVGDGARTLCGRAIVRDEQDTAHPVQANALLERFLSRYAERVCHSSRIYAGALECLQWLRAQDCLLACVTNKPLEHTRELLQALELDGFFSLVFGGDSLAERKPDAMPLLECLRRFEIDAVDALMVGDSMNDIAAARSAGVESICVTYGYNQGQDVNELGATKVVESLAELPRCFEMTTAAGRIA